MRFFWRIFISAWVIVVLTMGFTFWVAGWLPDAERGSGDAAVAEQLASLVARDLRRQLDRDPATTADALAREQALDFGPLLQVFVVDAAGNDVRGRRLPDAVARSLEGRGTRAAGSPAPASERVHIRDAGLDGYAVVAYEGFFPLGRELTRPGVREILVAVSLLVSAAASLMLARFVVLPVRRLQSAGRKVAAGDLSVRVAPTVGSRTDDIATLARDFDLMTERVDALLQSRHRLLRDVSHELRSPLARLQAMLSIARQQKHDGDMALIDRMEAELERLDNLIGDILAYSRLEHQDGVARQPTDIVDLVQNIVDDASLEGLAADKEIRLQGPARCVIAADAGLMQRAVENVVRNALRYTAEGTAVDVRVVEEQGAIRIVVEDHGPGVPTESLARIFEPFFRVEDSRATNAGSGGIGLAIAARSVRLHGGTISARNRAAGGLSVEIVVPPK